MSERRDAQPETLRVARDYLALGWHVVPVRPGEKMPAVRWADYTTHAATADEITHWFSVGGYGIGLVQGSTAGTVVLDFDGEDGWDTLRALEREHGELPESPRQITPGGGIHYVFRHPGRHVPTRKGILPGFDVRGDGGFIVAYPSKHPNGRPYAWDVDAHYEDVAVAECPTWIVDLVCSDVPAGDVNAVVYAPRKLGLGLSEAVVVDGREQYMRNTVLAVYRELWAELGRRPLVDELFDRAWPQYSRKADLTRPGRGAHEVRRKCEHTISRGLAGRLPVKEPAPKVDSAPENEDKVDPETGEVRGLLATPFDPARLLAIPPRRWVYGHFLIRRFVSVLGAPGGVGKTAYSFAVGVCVALERALLDEKVHEGGPVWLYNLEDPRDELERRLAAIIQLHDIDPADLVDKLYVDTGREQQLIIAKVAPDGSVVATPQVDELIAEIRRRGVRLLIVDPFVKSHKLIENANEQVDFAATQWSKVADQADCTILLVHHFRKGGMSGDAAAFRGASALVDASRSALSLATMDENEASKLGVEDEERRFYVRADNAKLNLAPPPTDTTWLKLEGVQLPNGDNVQAVRRWQPPSPWDGFPMPLVVRILNAIGKGPRAGEQYTASSTRSSSDRWAGKVVCDIGGKTPGQAKEILKKWIDNGLLIEGTYKNAQRKVVGGLAVDGAKLAEMSAAGGLPDDD